MKDAEISTADWKIVNSHYSPFNHMAPKKMNEWFHALRSTRSQIFMNAHTQGFSHAVGKKKLKTHFFQNGAGGGLPSEITSSAIPTVAEKQVKGLWASDGTPYGFFELGVSKQWMRLRFITFDDKWNFKGGEQTKGGIKINYCYYVPQSGGIGKTC